MNKKQAQVIADRVIEYLFFDGDDKPHKPVTRLMLVYGGEDFKNPGWGRESVRESIVEQIMKSAQQSVQPTLESGRKMPAKKSNRKGSAPAKSG
jgi:hypothetical protein